jgi:hypothetical protein
MAGNERLAALMTEAGFLDRSGSIGRKRFARAVTDSPAGAPWRSQLQPHVRESLARRCHAPR